MNGMKAHKKTFNIVSHLGIQIKTVTGTMTHPQE